ncbi:MAG: hypothetical protein IJR47_00540 [Clostridia bacterium]|nr:hypothetical protein [Clostridia bacterium]
MTIFNNNVTIPQLVDIETAIRIFYERLELSTQDIYELFGNISKSRMQKLKKLAKARMIELNIPAYGLHTVNTKVAFEAWGIDIKDLEQRRNKLKELGLGAKNSFRIQLPNLAEYYTIESDLRQADFKFHLNFQWEKK